jgi:hypothetical protein
VWYGQRDGQRDRHLSCVIWAEGRTEGQTLELCDMGRGTDRGSDMTEVIVNLLHFANVP